jgi:hypothetical protein
MPGCPVTASAALAPNPPNSFATNPALAKEKKNTPRKGTRLSPFPMIGGYFEKVGAPLAWALGSNSACCIGETAIWSVNRRVRGYLHKYEIG